MSSDVYKKGLVAVLFIIIIIATILSIKFIVKDKDIFAEGKEDIILTNINEDEAGNKENNNTNKENVDNIFNNGIIVIIDIDGEVNNPSVYEFKEGDRVNDAIMKAGGLTEKAYTKNINKARKLIDGEKIYIPSEEEIQLKEVLQSEGDIINFDLENEVNNKININNASKQILISLDGIGEVYSQRIIDYRNKTKFSSIQEIKNVSGIGEKTFEKIKDKITVND